MSNPCCCESAEGCQPSCWILQEHFVFFYKLNEVTLGLRAKGEGEAIFIGVAGDLNAQLGNPFRRTLACGPPVSLLSLLTFCLSFRRRSVDLSLSLLAHTCPPTVSHGEISALSLTRVTSTHKLELLGISKPAPTLPHPAWDKDLLTF